MQNNPICCGSLGMSLLQFFPKSFAIKVALKICTKWYPKRYSGKFQLSVLKKASHLKLPHKGKLKA